MLELKTRDGMYLMGEEDRQALHDTAHGFARFREQVAKVRTKSERIALTDKDAWFKNEISKLWRLSDEVMKHIETVVGKPPNERSKT